MFNFNFFYLIFFIGLGFLNVACAKTSTNGCNSNNVEEKFQCIRKENFLLEKELKKLKNNERKDFTLWKKGIENRCESKKSYTLGEGVGLVKEECYRGEYINRLNEIGRYNGRVLKEINKKNDDGFSVTLLPYNTDDHINCILKNSKASCDKVNLIDVSALLKVYNELDENYGGSVIFPESKNGVILIASPSSSDSGRAVINLTSVNALGLFKKITIDASNNITINENYEIFYTKNGKLLKITLNNNGEFVVN